jgi:POT family proton-dependent oligopeptide transporter
MLLFVLTASYCFDLQVYPAIRRAGLNFSALKRITAGFISGAMAMVWAGVVQHYIYKVCTDAAGQHLLIV